MWLPKTLAYILREWKKSQDELKGFLGDEYQDFDLVVALPNGRPCEDRIILKEFAKLREDAGLPKVVFHSLRHSSTTYKLSLIHIFDESGEGTMTAHKIFDGAFVMYSDMHLKECTSYFQSSTDSSLLYICLLYTSRPTCASQSLNGSALGDGMD